MPLISYSLPRLGCLLLTLNRCPGCPGPFFHAESNEFTTPSSGVVLPVKTMGSGLISHLHLEFVSSLRGGRFPNILERLPRKGLSTLFNDTNVMTPLMTPM